MQIDPTIVAIVTGLNSGILIVLLVLIAIIFVPRRRTRAEQPEADAGPSIPTPRNAPPQLRISIATANLAAAIGAHTPNWEAIEIANLGEGQLSMQITLADGQKIDPNKLN